MNTRKGTMLRARRKHDPDMPELCRHSDAEDDETEEPPGPEEDTEGTEQALSRAREQGVRFRTEERERDQYDADQRAREARLASIDRENRRLENRSFREYVMEAHNKGHLPPGWFQDPPDEPAAAGARQRPPAGSDRPTATPGGWDRRDSSSTSSAGGRPGRDAGGRYVGERQSASDADTAGEPPGANAGRRQGRLSGDHGTSGSSSTSAHTSSSAGAAPTWDQGGQQRGQARGTVKPTTAPKRKRSTAEEARTAEETPTSRQRTGTRSQTQWKRLYPGIYEQSDDPLAAGRDSPEARQKRRAMADHAYAHRPGPRWDEQAYETVGSEQKEKRRKLEEGLPGTEQDDDYTIGEVTVNGNVLNEFVSSQTHAIYATPPEQREFLLKYGLLLVHLPLDKEAAERMSDSREMLDLVANHWAGMCIVRQHKNDSSTGRRLIKLTETQFVRTISRIYALQRLICPEARERMQREVAIVLATLAYGEEQDDHCDEADHRILWLPCDDSWVGQFLFYHEGGTIRVVPRSNQATSKSHYEGPMLRTRRLQAAPDTALFLGRGTIHAGDEPLHFADLVALKALERLRRTWVPRLMSPDPLGRTLEQQRRDIDEFQRARIVLGADGHITTRMFGWFDGAGRPRKGDDAVSRRECYELRRVIIVEKNLLNMYPPTFILLTEELMGQGLKSGDQGGCLRGARQREEADAGRGLVKHTTYPACDGPSGSTPRQRGEPRGSAGSVPRWQTQAPVNSSTACRALPQEKLSSNTSGAASSTPAQRRPLIQKRDGAAGSAMAQQGSQPPISCTSGSPSPRGAALTPTDSGAARNAGTSDAATAKKGSAKCGQDAWDKAIAGARSKAAGLLEVTRERMAQLPTPLFEKGKLDSLYSEAIGRAFEVGGAVWSQGKAISQLHGFIGSVFKDGTALQPELERRIIGGLLTNGILSSYTLKSNAQKKRLPPLADDPHGLGIAFLEGSYWLLRRQPPSRIDPQGAVTRTQLRDGVSTNEAAPDDPPLWFVVRTDNR